MGITIDLQLGRWIDRNDDLAAHPITDFSPTEVGAAQPRERRPPGKPNRSFSRKKHHIKEAIIHRGMQRGIQPTGVLATVGDDEGSRSLVAERLTVDLNREERGPPPTHRLKNRPCIGPLGNPPRPRRVDLRHNPRIKPDRRHDQQDVAGGCALLRGQLKPTKIDPPNRPAKKPLRNLFGRLGPSGSGDLAGEEVLGARRIVKQRNCRRCARWGHRVHQTVAAYHDHRVVVSQHRGKPRLDRAHLALKRRGAKPFGLQNGAELINAPRRPPRPRDRIEDDQSPHVREHTRPAAWFRTMPSMIRVLPHLLLATAVLYFAPLAAAQQEEFVLNESDSWEHKPIEPGSPEALVLRARKAIAEGHFQRARAMASAFLDKAKGTDSPRQPDMLLVRGDALVAMGDEDKALFDYEDIARKYPGSDVFVVALEREYEIAVQYAHGLRKKFMGMVRIINAGDDAQELLILIQERLPGSRLGEQAGMQLADYYFNTAKLRLAAEAYDLFILNYPRSEQISKARVRLIESYLASYRGPAFDASGLRDAHARLETLRLTQPALAQRHGSGALLIRIYESQARKLLRTADWYRSVKDPVSAEQYLRRLVKRYPNSVATRTALRSISTLLADLPEAVLETAPDYTAIAEALLGTPGSLSP